MNDEYSKWQSLMSQKVIICEDEEDEDNDTKDNIDYVGGFDTSMCKMDQSQGVAALIIIKITPSFEIVYEDYENVFFDLQDQEQMYVPGMLGRREVPAYLKLLSRLHERDFVLFEKTIYLVDGGGLLHPRRFGSACQLALQWGEQNMSQIRTVGVAKNYLHVGDQVFFTYTNDEDPDLGVDICVSVPEKNNTPFILGRAGRFGKNSLKPIYVSIGHRISLNKACAIVKKCCLYRIPEPIRQADLRSRSRCSER